jgi:hypothetical protein
MCTVKSPPKRGKIKLVGRDNDATACTRVPNLKTQGGYLLLAGPCARVSAAFDY